jgi:hypothetical protein
MMRLYEDLGGDELPPPLPAALAAAAEEALDLLSRLSAATAAPDAAAAAALARLRRLWADVSSPSARRGEPRFIFREGPVTRAAQEGGLLLLEDFDAPSQAVTERLNSLLEPEPSFAVTEDVTACDSGGGGDATDGALPGGFQVFATVHTGADGRRPPKLSPATLSRFTPVYVAPYEDEPGAPTGAGACNGGTLHWVLQHRLLSGLAGGGGFSAAGPGAPGKRERQQSSKTATATAAALADMMLSISRAAAEQAGSAADISSGGAGGLRSLLRWADFVAGHVGERCLEARVVAGARFFALDSLSSEQQAQLLAAWLRDSPAAAALPPAARAACARLAAPPAAPPEGGVFEDPASVLEVVRGRLVIKSSGVSAPLSPRADPSALARLPLSLAPSTVASFERVFAAMTAGVPLLLEGPPGAWGLKGFSAFDLWGKSEMRRGRSLTEGGRTVTSRPGFGG